MHVGPQRAFESLRRASIRIELSLVDLERGFAGLRRSLLSVRKVR